MLILKSVAWFGYLATFIPRHGVKDTNTWTSLDLFGI